jgi:hypothetical protein
VGKAGLERPQVAVDIGEQREDQCNSAGALGRSY